MGMNVRGFEASGWNDAGIEQMTAGDVGVGRVAASNVEGLMIWSMRLGHRAEWQVKARRTTRKEILCPKTVNQRDT
jgi:hypothetical protein